MGYNVPCLLAPMGAIDAAAHGLALQSQPTLFVFGEGEDVTNDSDGTDYATTLIVVDEVTYIATEPQTDYPGYGGDAAHVQVIAMVRRT